ncbi:hypothetical protein GCM10010129_79620 [Streptomyces fumigatiscleroticus]|nr:hypothetical protein GCM10010129_79620 [Streptomyces fumigatiscleroticus]
MAWSQLAPDMRFALTRAARQTTIRLAGELDAASARALLREVELPGAGCGRVVLDASRVTFCDGAGVHLLLILHDQAAAAGGELILKAAHSAVLRVLLLSRRPAAVRLARSCTAQMRSARHPHHRLLRQALTLALRLTDAPLGNAQIWDPRTQTLRIVTQRGHDFLTFFEAVSDRDSACGTAALDLRPVFVEEVAAHPAFLGTPALDVLADVPVAAVASLPLTTPANELIGVISLHRHHPAHWPTEQRHQLHSLTQATGQLAADPASDS